MSEIYRLGENASIMIGLTRDLPKIKLYYDNQPAEIAVADKKKICLIIKTDDCEHHISILLDKKQAKGLSKSMKMLRKRLEVEEEKI